MGRGFEKMITYHKIASVNNFVSVISDLLRYIHRYISFNIKMCYCFSNDHVLFCVSKQGHSIIFKRYFVFHYIDVPYFMNY